jgi:ribosomal protein L6P/L9E
MVEAVRMRVFVGDTDKDEADFDGIVEFGVNDVDEIVLEGANVSVVVNISDLFKALGTVEIGYKTEVG